MSDGTVVDGGAPTPIDAARVRELVRALSERNAQLEHALESRIVIEQAKGILSERYGMPIDRAFEVLRRAARNHRVRIHALAAEVVERRETPPPIEEALR